MEYILTFLEGVMTFISPCLLPMIPVYVAYFAGGTQTKSGTIKNSVSFVCGFTVVFLAMGALAGSFGVFLKKHAREVDIVTGLIVIFFGLIYLGVFKLKIFRGMKFMQKTNRGMLSSFIFGFTFSVGWTPCVGAFLGSALMMASQQGEVVKGMLMLLIYSLGLGIPFILSAVLIDSFKSAFNFIKRNYKVINTVCGSLLIVMGILMAFGLFRRFIYSLL